MVLRIIVILVISREAWCEDPWGLPSAEQSRTWTDADMPGQAAGGLPDRLRYPLFGQLMVTLDPYSGTGPYHFDNLSTSPYYARYKDIEIGLRIGLIYPLSGHLLFEFQLPITANPSPAYPEPLQTYGPLDSDRHFDASVGLLWTF